MINPASNRKSKNPRYCQRGHLQQQVTPKEHNAASREYRELYGAPYDRTRAELYLALKAARTVATGDLALRIDLALAAEVAAQ